MNETSAVCLPTESDSRARRARAAAGPGVATFFADPELGLAAKGSGWDWRLRAYPSLSGLAAMVPVNAPSLRRGFECRWEAVDDHPDVARTKIGRYVSTIQSELWWSLEGHPSTPKYCLPVPSKIQYRRQDRRRYLHLFSRVARVCGGAAARDFRESRLMRRRLARRDESGAKRRRHFAKGQIRAGNDGNENGRLGTVASSFASLENARIA